TFQQATPGGLADKTLKDPNYKGLDPSKVAAMHERTQPRQKGDLLSQKEGRITWIHDSQKQGDAVFELHVMIHEALHAYTHPDFGEKMRTHHNLLEGFTEYFARQVSKKKKVPITEHYNEY